MSRFERTGWKLMPTPALMLALSPDIKCYQKEED